MGVGKMKRIVFPEGNDERIIKAAEIISLEGIAEPILLKNNDINLGMEMLKNGEADGLVCGACHTTAETISSALRIIGLGEGVKLASSYFLMKIKGQTYFFADCGLNVNPTAEELSEIAIQTANSAKEYGIEPRVAMLSYSTKGSGRGPLVDKVVEATRLIREKAPDLQVDGELQLDAAIVPEIGIKKAQYSSIAGRANVLIFPDLNSGNIGYKLVERFAGATAIGPIIQGLAKPVNDLSRGCSIEDIVNVAAITGGRR